MKSNKKPKKLEFTKETIARLGDQSLSSIKGGSFGTATKVGTSCTCVTYASRREPCHD